MSIPSLHSIAIAVLGRRSSDAFTRVDVSGVAMVAIETVRGEVARSLEPLRKERDEKRTHADALEQRHSSRSNRIRFNSRSARMATGGGSLYDNERVRTLDPFDHRGHLQLERAIKRMRRDGAVEKFSSLWDDIHRINRVLRAVSVCLSYCQTSLTVKLRAWVPPVMREASPAFM